MTTATAQTTGNHHTSTVPKNSWAAVASQPTKQESSSAVKAVPDSTAPGATPAHSTEITTEEDGVFVPAVEARVVWIKPLKTDIKIDTRMVAEVITQGPLYSIAYSPRDHAVCVIFQKTEHAEQFLLACSGRAVPDGDSPLGPHFEVLPGQGYSNLEELKRMEFPRNERRRLTFARAALFCYPLTEERFKADIFRMVGADNVELVWLFNSGNGKADLDELTNRVFLLTLPSYRCVLWGCGGA